MAKIASRYPSLIFQLLSPLLKNSLNKIDLVFGLVIIWSRNRTNRSWSRFSFTLQNWVMTSRRATLSISSSQTSNKSGIQARAWLVVYQKQNKTPLMIGYRNCESQALLRIENNSYLLQNIPLWNFTVDNSAPFSTFHWRTRRQEQHTSKMPLEYGE